jgi:hypothetical protein
VGSLLEIGLANALFAGMLALAAVLAGRFSRRPALVHSLWVLVLIKLITPPVWIPVPWLAAQATTAPRNVVPDSTAPDASPRRTAVAVVQRGPNPAPADEQPPAMRIDELSKAKPDMPGGPQMREPGMPAPAPQPDPDEKGQESTVKGQEAAVKGQEAGIKGKESREKPGLHPPPRQKLPAQLSPVRRGHGVGPALCS